MSNLDYLKGATVKLSATGATRQSLECMTFGVYDKMLAPEMEGTVAGVQYVGDGQAAIMVESENDPSNIYNYSMDELEVVKLDTDQATQASDDEAREIVNNLGSMLGQLTGMDVEIREVSEEQMEGLINGTLDVEDFIDDEDDDESAEEFDEEDFDFLEDEVEEVESYFEVVDQSLFLGTHLGGKDAVVFTVKTTLGREKSERLAEQVVESMELPDHVVAHCVYIHK